MVINGKNFKVGGIIQARINSTRLPNKILLNLPYNSKQTLLENIIYRAKKSLFIDDVVVATTNLKPDDVVEDLCKSIKINCFRGEEEDVLSRYFNAAKKYSFDIVVRLTGDNPCIDFELIDKTITRHIENNNDYTKTILYPLGINVEVLSFSVLKKSFTLSNNEEEREHVTLFIINNLAQFKIEEIKASNKYQNLNLRLTVDKIEDYALMCCIFDELWDSNKNFNLGDIALLFGRKPWLKFINGNVMQKEVFASEIEELKEAVKILNLQELNKAAKVLDKFICSHF